jgi:ankyrin repeat protein
MMIRSSLIRYAMLFFAGLPFLAFGVTPNESALLNAARLNDEKTVAQVLANTTDLEARDSSGATALMLATRANAVDAAKALILAGADVNAKDRIHDSPYLYAGARGHLEILKMTLAHGADLKSTNRYGGTALIPAAERGHVETVRTLIDAGVAVDHVNNLHWTALLEAVILGDGGPAHQKIVELLLNGGANPNLADGNGITPLQHAKKAGYREIEKTLVAAGGR